eukprot:1339819-Rhodomonas_salina.3
MCIRDRGRRERETHRLGGRDGTLDGDLHRLGQYRRWPMHIGICKYRTSHRHTGYVSTGDGLRA